MGDNRGASDDGRFWGRSRRLGHREAFATMAAEARRHALAAPCADCSRRYLPRETEGYRRARAWASDRGLAAVYELRAAPGPTTRAGDEEWMTCSTAASPAHARGLRSSARATSCASRRAPTAQRLLTAAPTAHGYALAAARRLRGLPRQRRSGSSADDPGAASWSRSSSVILGRGARSAASDPPRAGLLNSTSKGAPGAGHTRVVVLRRVRRADGASSHASSRRRRRGATPSTGARSASHRRPGGSVLRTRASATDPLPGTPASGAAGAPATPFPADR